SNSSNEIIAAPKVYGFDTGFVAFFKGWREMHAQDKGLLWEHFVLNELQGHLQTRDIYYWRDKLHHEIDFVIKKRGSTSIAIECKWSDANDFDFKNLRAFRRLHPEGKNFLVVQNLRRSYIKSYDGIKLQVVNLSGLLQSLN